MLPPSVRTPAPSQLLEAVRAVFEHAGFTFDLTSEPPAGADFIVHPANQISERFAIACFAESAAPEVVSVIASCARRAEIPHVQVITTAPIPEATRRIAEGARVMLTDAQGFDAAVKALPEAMRLRLAPAAAIATPAASIPTPSYAGVLYGNGPAPAKAPSREQAPGRKGPSLAFLITMSVLLVTAATVTFTTASRQMAVQKKLAMRHAENIASVAGAANAAGHDFVEMALVKTPQGVAESVARGAVISEESSPFFGVAFGVDLTARQVLNAVPYLAIERGELVYRPGTGAGKPAPRLPAKPAAPRPAPVPSTDGATMLVTEAPAKSSLIIAPIPVTAETPSWETHCRPVMQKYFMDAWNFEAIQEPDARKLATGLVDFHTGAPLTLPRDETTGILRKYSSKYPALFLASLAFVDPEYLRDTRMEDVRKDLETMLRDDPHAPLLEWQLASIVAGQNPSGENRDRAFAALSRLLDETGGLTSVPDFLAIHLLLESKFSRDFFALEHEFIAGAVWDHALTPEWLKEFVIGRHHHWAAVALASVIDTSPEAKEKETLEFTGHLDRGLAALNASWTANPNVPETAAAMMLMIALDGGKRELCREWFNRAVSLRADCPEAYANQLELLTASRDFKALQDFGAACLATGRFDTHVPHLFFDSHFTRSRLSHAPAEYWSSLSARELARFEEYFRGFEAHPDAMARKELNQTREALYRLWRGEAREMEQCLAGLKAPHESTVKQYGMTLEQFAGAADRLRQLEAKLSPSVSPETLRTPAAAR